MKVVVYAICKNESKHIKRWVASMKEADEMIVLDTGSTDNSVSLLKENQVKVYERKILPWRFDTARNICLSYVPKDTDICVATDIDEVFMSGWREILEKIWQKEKPTRVRFNYNWKLSDTGIPLVSFMIDKIHNLNYHWENIVHEVLVSNKKEEIIEVPITLNHYPDSSKSRQSYLSLLELSVKEDPNNDRNLHYLGREYMYYQKWDQCIHTLHQHLNCPKATWKDERCASMRFLGRAYFAKGYMEEAEGWWLRSIKEASYLKEGYVELASFYLYQERSQEALKYIRKANRIKEKSKSYINEEFAWNDAYYELYSMILFMNGDYKGAIKKIKLAIKMNPNQKEYVYYLNLILPYSLNYSF